MITIVASLGSKGISGKEKQYGETVSLLKAMLKWTSA